MIKVFMVNGSADNFTCGWCYMGLESVTECMTHAEEHFTLLKEMEENSKYTLSISPKEDECQDTEENSD